MSCEQLGIMAEIQATRDRYPRHVARWDRTRVTPVWLPAVKVVETVKKPARRVVATSIPPDSKHAEIMEAFCAALGTITVDDLKSPRRMRPLARPRHVAMKLVKELTGLSSTQLGAAFGNRERCGARHGLRKADIRMAEDPALRAAYDAVFAAFTEVA